MILTLLNFPVFLEMFGSRGMQSLMQQMVQNPQLIENMMQAPYMQAMLQSMSANPEMANQVPRPHKHRINQNGKVFVSHTSQS